MVSGTSLEHASEARAALRAIVSDPDLGAAALSNATVTANLLKDLLPDAPREAGILIAVAENGLVDFLRGHIAQGLDGDIAIRLTAARFGQTTAFAPDICEWAARELALALGLVTPGGAGSPGAAGVIPASTLEPQAPPTSAAPATAVPAPQATAPPAPAPQAPVPPATAPPAQVYYPQANTIPPQGSGPAPTETATAVRPGWPPSQPGGPAPAKRRRTKPVLIIAGVLVAAAIAASVTVVALSSKPSSATPMVSISASSSTPRVSGVVYVGYQDGSYADATINGVIRHAADGEVARLTAQRFPFTSAPIVLGSRQITRKSQLVSFSVVPTLATRYQIEVFRSSSATTPLVRSAARSVYVSATISFKVIHNACTGTQCRVTVRMRTLVPPAELQTEAAKQLYAYFAVKLAAGKVPGPKTLYLQPNVSPSGLRKLSSDPIPRVTR